MFSLCFFKSRLPSSLDKIDADVLFLQSKITEVLGGSGYNTERLGTPYVPQYTGEEPLKSASLIKKQTHHLQLFLNVHPSKNVKCLQFLSDEDRLSKRKSIGETISIQMDVESRNSPEKKEVTSLKNLKCTHLN